MPRAEHCEGGRGKGGERVPSALSAVPPRSSLVRGSPQAGRSVGVGRCRRGPPRPGARAEHADAQVRDGWPAVHSTQGARLHAADASYSTPTTLCVSHLVLEFIVRPHRDGNRTNHGAPCLYCILRAELRWGAARARRRDCCREGAGWGRVRVGTVSPLLVFSHAFHPDTTRPFHLLTGSVSRGDGVHRGDRRIARQDYRREAEPRDCQCGAARPLPQIR
eukprot:scaffold8424_cov120-Isochrysis_galbana.AAC.1